MTHGYKRIMGEDKKPLVEQAVVAGLPLTWNPDDERFYVHEAGTTDGTNVLGTFKEFRNAVQFARTKGT